MFDIHLPNEDLPCLPFSGNGASRIQIVAHRPHISADLAILYIPGYRAAHERDPKAGAVRQAAQNVGADAFFFNYHGHSPEEAQTNLCLETYRNNAKDALEDVLKVFKHQHVVICSHSMGAVFALTMAARYHRNVVGCLLIAPVIGLMDPPVKDTQGEVVIEGGLGHKRITLVPDIAKKLNAGETVSPRGISILQYDPKFIADYANWGSMERIPSGIQCPTAIISAERDPFVHATHICAIQKKIPGASVQFVPGATHEMKEEAAITALTDSLMTHVPRMRQHAQGHSCRS